MKAFIAVLLAAATVAGAAVAQEDGRGFYLKGFGGLSTLLGDDVTFRGSLDGGSGVSYGSGLIAGGALGFAYNPNLAAEVEYAYRTGDADGFRDGVASSGDFASTSVMLNAIYTFDALGNGVRPYVGLGIGAANEIDFDLEGGPNKGEYNDTWIFAFQGIAGLSYDITETWRLNGEVRYFDAGTPTLSGPDGARLEARYNTFDALVGVTYRF